MKYWKLIGGTVWKLYVGLIFFLTAFLLFPLFYMLLSNEKWKKHTFHISTMWSWIIRIFCFYHVRFQLKSELPKGPYIIIANHSSYIDIFLMNSIFPHHPFVFLGKSELLDYPVLGMLFRKLHIPVFRTNKLKAAKTFIQSKNMVKDGWSLMIFPEGGIPDKNLPKMMVFKEGAFKLAKSLQVPIIPVTFINNHKLFSDPMTWYGGAKPGISDVYIHPYIDVQTINSLTDEELSQRCYDTINQPLVKHYPEIQHLEKSDQITNY